LKIKELIVSAAVIFTLTTSISFAAPGNTGIEHVVDTKIQEKGCEKQPNDPKMKRDPIKDLEEKKSKIQNLLKEGKISQEKADEILAHIDKRIGEIKEFDKLTLEQKKEKLTKDFKAHLDQMVNEGKMTKDEADKMMKMITEKLKDWDGTGYLLPHGRKYQE